MSLCLRGTRYDLPAGERGITLVEVMIAGILSAIVALAILSMFVTSIETWEQSGARVSTQREADRVVGGIADRVRSGSSVAVGADSTSLWVYRKTASGDSLIASYQLSGTELQTGSGTVLLRDVTWLEFESEDLVSVKIRLRVEDDMGTPSLVEDDEGARIEMAAYCRNQVAFF